METERDFDKLTVDELIADDSFMQWVKQPDEELEAYWQSVMTAHPHAKNIVEEARDLVQKMHFARHVAKPGRKEFVFDRIIKEVGDSTGQPEIKEQPEQKEELNKTVVMRRYLQIAAAVLLVSVSGVWFYTRYGTKSTEVLPKTGNVAAAANKGLLFLSNGEIVNLDALQVGTIVEKGALRITLPEPKHLVFEGNGAATPISVDSLLSPIGQVWQVELTDESKVWLNSGSIIRWAGVATGMRGADISGQAYFEVSPRDNVPFVVRLNEVEVDVLGTEFDVVNYRDDAAAVTLVKGRVQVKHDRGRAHQLKIGEQAAYHMGEMEPNIAKANLKQVLAWKEGVFAFNEMEVEEVMTLIERWYGIKVVYNGSKPKARINGTIPHESSLREVLDILQSIGGDARFEINEDTVVVTSAKAPSNSTD